MDELTLSAPRVPAADEAIWLELEVGPLPPGARLRVLTPAGEPVGTVAPFGAQAATAGGRYLVPLPPGAIHDGRAVLRLEVEEPTPTAPRAPAVGEVTAARLVVVPVTR